MHGWSPSTVTYDAAGDVVTVSVQEPRFTPREVALLLASRRDEQRPRGRHGLLLEETTDPARQYDWVVDLPTMDFAQARLAREQEAYAKKYPDADQSSLLWRVRLKDA